MSVHSGHVLMYFGGKDIECEACQAIYPIFMSIINSKIKEFII